MKFNKLAVAVLASAFLAGGAFAADEHADAAKPAAAHGKHGGKKKNAPTPAPEAPAEKDAPKM